MLIQNLFLLIVTDYSAMHCYYSCGLPNCLTSKVSKLAQNWGSKWPWYAIIVIFLHYWRAIFFVLWPGRRSSWCVTYLRNGILLPKLFSPTVRKKYSSYREKLLKFEAEGQEFCKIFEITWIIYSNSESFDRKLFKFKKFSVK